VGIRYSVGRILFSRGFESRSLSMDAFGMAANGTAVTRVLTAVTGGKKLRGIARVIEKRRKSSQRRGGR